MGFMDSGWFIGIKGALITFPSPNREKVQDEGVLPFRGKDFLRARVMLLSDCFVRFGLLRN